MEDDYWEFGTNKWSKEHFSYKEALKQSKTLINCKYCINCYNCKDCIACESCDDCNQCSCCDWCDKCTNCHNTNNCKNIEGGKEWKFCE